MCSSRTRRRLGPASDDAFKAAAAAGADWNKTFYQITTDQPGKDAWPLTNPTFILMYKVQDKPGQCRRRAQVLRVGLHNGDKMADELDYVPLPAAVKELVRKQWAAQIKDAAGKPVAFK